MTIYPILYLAPIAYYARLVKDGEILLECHENYLKGSYRNRCEILGANGLISLSIPLAGGRDQHQLYKKVKIAYQRPWQHQHWMSIVSAYSSSPFFEHYAHYFEPFYTIRYEYLWEYNRALTLLIIKLLKLDLVIDYTQHYEPVEGVDYRMSSKPNSPIEIKGGINYVQVFSHATSLASLSIIDLLFNTGTDAKRLLIPTT